MNSNRYFLIFSRSAVARILQAGSQFQGFLDRHLIPGGPVRRFPNGAVEFDEGRVKAELSEVLRSYRFPSSDPVIQGASTFPAIAPFYKNNYYSIQYSSEFQRKLRSEASFSVGRGMYQPPSPGEFDLEQLEITVGFRSRPSKATRIAFVAAVAEWARAASLRGAFDDGPVALASPAVSFNGVRAWFRIDARRSGQDTLNWLALAMLDFGEDVHTTTNVDFGESAEILEKSLGPIRGQTTIVGFAGDRREQVVAGADESAPTSHVPSIARPARGLRSRSFAVLALPIDEWDSFVATIYFGRSFQHDERKTLASLLGAWLLMASYGGLGGRGTHWTEEVAFDEATDSATLEADMGDVDPRVALRALIRSLEGFQSVGPPIDALVFGRSGWAETGKV